MFELSRRLQDWSAELNNHSGWSSAIGRAFDAIGFDEDFIETQKRSSSSPQVKAVKDHLWGMIHLDPMSTWIVDSPLIQRLRRIRQTGFTFLTYPNAGHTRFEHSLGVFHVITKLLSSFEDAKRAHSSAQPPLRLAATEPTPDYYPLDGREARLIRCAALLHDIGHGPFSHVSERAFDRRGADFRIGPFTVAEFEMIFMKHWEMTSPGRLAVDPKSDYGLTELMAAAVVTSDRFVSYLACGPAYCGSLTKARDDAHDIAALILGVRIDPHDFALPEILSGPVDADKVDYLCRDARACGVSTSIDVARVFVRAGIYQAPIDTVRNALGDVAGVSPGAEVKVFLIDQSGTDAVRELGDARQSLYRRVYHHQLTRNAEQHFFDMLDSIRSSGEQEASTCLDFLHLWTLSEDELIGKLCHVRAKKTRKTARALRDRRLLRRAACFSADTFLNPLPGHLRGDGETTDARKIPFTDALKALNALAADRTGWNDLVSAVADECALIRKTLLARGLKSPEDLPLDEAPDDVHILPFPDLREGLPKAPLIRRGDRIKRFDSRMTSRLHAEELSEGKGYLNVSADWREIAAIAFQSVLFRRPPLCFWPEYSLKALADDGNKVKLPWKGEFRLSLDLHASARASKVDTAKLLRIERALAQAGYFDSRPILYPMPVDQPIKDASQAFVQFAGEGAWRVDSRGDALASFLSQFPPRLRDAMSQQVIARLTVLDREAVTAMLVKGLKSLAPRDRLILAPLSSSSGYLCRTYLKDHLPYEIASSLGDALKELAKSPAARLVFIDDNLASGTQASRQLKIWFGKDSAPPHANYFASPLDEDQQKLLAERGFDLVIGAALDTGFTKVREAAQKCGIADNLVTCCKGDDLSRFSAEMSPDLEKFLIRVGAGLMRHRLRNDTPGISPQEAHELARARALGYDGLKGTLVTPLNVPTSTLTALWCPGTYTPEGDLDDDDAPTLPWIPLFIRQGMLRHLVLP